MIDEPALEKILVKKLARSCHSPAAAVFDHDDLG